jgi:hypothetical protein
MGPDGTFGAAGASTVITISRSSPSTPAMVAVRPVAFDSNCVFIAAIMAFAGSGISGMARASSSANCAEDRVA